jgi:hypothetical protein
MAIKLSAAYSKKLGLPGFSSHSFTVLIETELQNLDNVREASARLYESLQQAVDQQIQKTGFVPPDGYGMEVGNNGAWNCSQKQQELIQKIGKESHGKHKAFFWVKPLATMPRFPPWTATTGMRRSNAGRRTRARACVPQLYGAPIGSARTQ